MILKKNSLAARPLVIAVGILLLSSLALSAAVAAIALRPRTVVVVPGVKESRVVLPDEVPDAAVARFGLLYLYHLDNYTPADVEERSNWLLRFIAPEHQEKVIRDLTERATFVVRAKEASQLVLPLPSRCEVARAENGVFRFSAVAVRRIYIAGELKSETKQRYFLDLQPSLPTEDEPYGFVVVGQSIRPEGGDEAKADGRKR